MKLTKPDYFINRELSWLQFNERVLEEAEDKNNKLLERLKFLSIFASNLDEFFMVRVSGLKDLQDVGYTKKDSAGLTPTNQLSKISDATHKLIKRQYKCFNKSIKPALKKNDIVFLHPSDLKEQQMTYITAYFNDIIKPVLTPMAVDKGRPFPLLANKSLNIAIRLKDDTQDLMSFVQVPSVLPRIVHIPNESDTDKQSYILIEDIIMHFISDLFSGFTVYSTGFFKITRNADLSIDEEEAHDLLVEIEKQIQQRKWGKPVRLEISEDFDETLLDNLKKELSIETDDIYTVPGALDLATFMEFIESVKTDKGLKNNVIRPSASSDFSTYRNIFKEIKKKDRLLHLPYQSFMPVINLLKAAATDPKVLAIKQTLYRVSGDSPIIKWLMEAANNDKQVTVLVELKARFDEENNIIWARKLEQSGCHVIYGLPGLKIHSKLLLVIRKEPRGIARYVHIGTGNYNDKTAKLYTDMGLFTAKEAIGDDISSLFNYLTGYTLPPNFMKIVAAPMELRKFMIKSIDNEIENAKKGVDAQIIAKMNSLVDPGIISKFYEASNAGVKIQLIVRGICCLKSGIEDISENITVKSIVGRFLEHTRIYVFENGGNNKVYIGSPDLMPRNIDRRIETLCPIEQSDIKKRILKILDIQLKDKVKSRYQKPDGSYTSLSDNKKDSLSAQDEIYKYTKKNY